MHLEAYQHFYHEKKQSWFLFIPNVQRLCFWLTMYDITGTNQQITTST